MRIGNDSNDEPPSAAVRSVVEEELRSQGPTGAEQVLERLHLVVAPNSSRSGASRFRERSVFEL